MHYADAETEGEQVKQLVQLFTENATALTPPDFKLMLLTISLNCLAPEMDENGPGIALSSSPHLNTEKRL